MGDSRQYRHKKTAKPVEYINVNQGKGEEWPPCKLWIDYSSEWSPEQQLEAMSTVNQFIKEWNNSPLSTTLLKAQAKSRRERARAKFIAMRKKDYE